MPEIANNLMPLITTNLSERPNLHRNTIISLVPSITELLFDLGLGGRLIAVTDYCIHPEPETSKLPKIGGTKNPSVTSISALRPDLVIANKEENRRIDVERLARKEINVWLTEVNSTEDTSALLQQFADCFDLTADTLQKIEVLNNIFNQPTPSRHSKVFCPIWKDPWMSPAQDTYIDSLLSLCGAINVFHKREDSRYPKVSIDEIVNEQPDCVLLPSEPYEFTERDADQLKQLDIPAAKTGRIHLLDGSLISWYGFRALQAVPLLRSLLMRS